MLKTNNMQIYGHRCPYFTGIREHGCVFVIDLDEEGQKMVGVYGEERTTLHVHQDGVAYITAMSYNFRREEHEETVEKILSSDDAFLIRFKEWIKEHPLFRSKAFPYPIEFREDFLFGSDCISHDWDSLIAYLNNYEVVKDRKGEV